VPFKACLHRKGISYQSKHEFEGNGQDIFPDEFFSERLMKLLNRMAEAETNCPAS